ncbi:hypothetical protein ACDX78_19435 [Virgibacillus oceani]
MNYWCGLFSKYTTEYYVFSGLTQVLNREEPKAKEQPPLSNLLEKEKLLFAKEIEVMYDVKETDLSALVEEQLAAGTYEEKELLGEKYVTTAN